MMFLSQVQRQSPRGIIFQRDFAYFEIPENPIVLFRDVRLKKVTTLFHSKIMSEIGGRIGSGGLFAVPVASVGRSGYFFLEQADGWELRFVNSAGYLTNWNGAASSNHHAPRSGKEVLSSPRAISGKSSTVH